MREVTITITGINNYGEVTAEQVFLRTNPERPDIEIMKQAVVELETAGYGFKRIFNIQLS